MTIQYAVNAPVNQAAFLSLLHRSTLGERRPVNNQQCISGMLANSNLVVSAWQTAATSNEPTLVGIARSVTDFHYACYLSDLAVDETLQGQGIGKELMTRTLCALQPTCKIILVAAPKADGYYAKLGFQRNQRCWVFEPKPSNLV